MDGGEEQIGDRGRGARGVGGQVGGVGRGQVGGHGDGGGCL